MANTKQSKKRARQADAHRNRNAAQRSMLRSAIKRVVRAVEAKDKAGAKTAYDAAVPVIDAMQRKGHIHKNKAARHKSRLNDSIRALA
jgi:small subunit ribosomal protein S20